MQSKKTTLDDILARIRKKSRSSSEKGRMFEKLMVRYFKTNKIYKSRFTKVWLWNDYPERDGDRDTGIDIVAIEADGSKCGIQCKFYDDNTRLNLAEVKKLVAKCSERDSDGNLEYKSSILVYTGRVDNITPEADNHIQRTQTTTLLTMSDLQDGVDWSDMDKPKPVKPRSLRDYQKEALKNIVREFDAQDRGQLLMACGTGKTMVALHAAQKLAGRGGLVLYLVPSISLITQSMSAWSNDCSPSIPQHYLAVCSDDTSYSVEGGLTYDVQSRVTTKADEIAEFINGRPKDRMTVIFSTYHSLDRISTAIANSEKEIEFDIIFCDEAHRTTGIAKEDDAKSARLFTLVHDNDRVPSKRRLYMTATPRVYAEKIQRITDGNELKPYSMDDKKTYGPVFYKLSFSDAVNGEHLADFKVKVAVVPEDLVDREFQKAIAQNKDIPIDDRSKMVGIWHALNYPEDDEANWDPSDIKETGRLLQRVIAFATKIDKSKMFAGKNKEKIRNSFAQVVKEMNETYSLQTRAEVEHVDGKSRASERRRKMRWLEESNKDKNTCRIVSNARCLSEGVDVPALDGIVFLNPRKSQVDVVQAVGRVMRRAPGKKFGYVILPVVVPSGVDIDVALDQNEPYRIVWQVLNALKSHDENLEIEINRLILDKNYHNGDKGKGKGKVTPRISISVMGGKNALKDYAMFSKMKSKLVEKVGRQYHYDDFGRVLGRAANKIEMRIKNQYDLSKQRQGEIRQFTQSLRQLVNDSVTEAGAIQIISHHVILSEVFNILFKDEFTSHNPMSGILDDMAKKFGMDEELEDLKNAGFYKRVRLEVKGIETRAARQSLIKAIYGSFLSAADRKGADKHGVVYTPVEIVDFIIHSVDEILNDEFGLDFNQRTVKIFDPFAGTGTFIVRLIESGLIARDSLHDKYRHDMFANEIFLLAYYIAMVNIETSYQSVRKKYTPFKGIGYTDTLRLNPRYRQDKRHREAEPKIDDESIKNVHSLIRRQRWAHIHVIMGNPPYSAGQSSFNENNPNVKYDVLDKRIEETYARRTKTQLKNSLYDSYIRSIRWASDRLGDSGIIAFITNSGFIRAESAAGMRACLVEEFSEIWCYDLRGNARTQGETRKKEAGNVFGSGSRTPVAITFLVKNPKKRGCTIHYKDIGYYHDREQKLQIIKEAGSISGIKDWQVIKPDKYNDWLDKRRDGFTDYLAMGSKAKTGESIFKESLPGASTGRDPWVYNSSIEELASNIKAHIKHCNSQDLSNPDRDSKKVKWTSSLSNRLKNYVLKFNADNIRVALYRPFFKQYLYLDSILNERASRIPLLFPNKKSKNIVLCVPDKSPNIEFMPFITDIIPDLHIHPSTQCFSRYTYENGKKKDNVTDYALNEFIKRTTNNEQRTTNNEQRTTNNEQKLCRKITKQYIFYYVYGMLHHTGYKTKFANNLSKQLPHIPIAPNFWAFADAGKELAGLHLNYDTGKRHSLGKPPHKIKKFTEMSFVKKRVQVDGEIKKVDDTTKLEIDGELIFENIPQVKYRVNNRTPLEWIVDRYRVTPNKDSGIVNDPTNIDIIALIERVVYVGLESDKIIEELSKEEFEPRNWKPEKKNLEKFMD